MRTAAVGPELGSFGAGRSEHDGEHGDCKGADHRKLHRLPATVPEIDALAQKSFDSI
jgi:hypothetical protein